MRSIIVILTSTLLVTRTAVAGQPPSPRRADGVISGHITSTASDPISGAAVMLLRSGDVRGQALQTTSARDGHFVFEQLGEGHYMLTANQEGYAQSSLLLELGAGQRLSSVTLPLPRAASISGRVFNVDATPARNIFVSAEPYDRTGWRIEWRWSPNRTDADAHYRIDGLSPGSYFVSARVDRLTEASHFSPASEPTSGISRR